MFGWLRNKRKETKDVRSSRVSVRIVAFVITMQLRWAGWMGKLFERLPLQRQRLVLISFVVIAGGYSIWISVAGFVTQPSPVVAVRSIQQSKYVTNPGDVPGVRSALADKDAQMIVSFQKYVDSLSMTAEGRVKLDSIKRTRPGLLDSLEQISILYKIK